ncbi:UDP-3-O-(3-hydroxymyristoyl)glucosamine N-acyltransferase [Hansschlegelia sp. KR7-227]|uniref:UDP-3-O-(3-hydroxymyristoyl)glucosamine N-acyltransferase n=1 Tax=Hansschlegelia sp. KR7-227 TaxID=3400914 RepID=UPI003BFD9E9A
MIQPRFLPQPKPLDLDRLLALTGARALGAAPGGFAIDGLAAIGRAGPSDLVLVDDARELRELTRSRAGACLLSPETAERAAEGRPLLLATLEPARAFATVATALYAHPARPQAMFGPGVAAGAVVHPNARLETDVSVDPGAVIGPRAEIGQGAIICANAVVGPDVRIGRHSVVGPCASIANALIGDRVVVHAGARVGGRGPGAPRRVLIGRVILQDDVSIGANCVIDAGALLDTVIGEGAHIANLVAIGADAMIGRRCVVLGLGLAGGERIPDYAVTTGAAPTRERLDAKRIALERRPESRDGALEEPAR